MLEHKSTHVIVGLCFEQRTLEGVDAGMVALEENLGSRKQDMDTSSLKEFSLG